VAQLRAGCERHSPLAPGHGADVDAPPPISSLCSSNSSGWSFNQPRRLSM
jgi:hypothetical protein